MLHDSWCATGDLALVNPEGCIHVVDRSHDVVVVGHDTVSGLELEGVLAALPAVRESFGIGPADPLWGKPRARRWWGGRAGAPRTKNWPSTSTTAWPPASVSPR